MGIALQLTGQAKDLGGGFVVRRFLPAAQRQSVGPFLFFDHFGPVTVVPGAGHDVRPHPHIGLATVTYLFEGAIKHRDSLGSVQTIEPGAINWMTSGRGIVHSERQPAELKNTTYVNHGIQLWAALPQAFEEVEPSFTHTPAHTIPELTVGDAQVRVLIGEAWGQTSPVATFAPTIYLDVQLNGTLDLPVLAQEMAVYLVDGSVEIDGVTVPDQSLAMLMPGVNTQIRSTAPVRLMVLGGDALDGHRFIRWNFVSSRKERILQAEADWQAQTMGQVPGDAEFIPLPAKRLAQA
ncbi:MAG: pirin family protein [Rhodoferax sp.]|uniref:pirin family protein n=1 Tax=Rhodoferax sp. TaxID=50421 RepID=UPI003267346B